MQEAGERAQAVDDPGARPVEEVAFDRVNAPLAHGRQEGEVLPLAEPLVKRRLAVEGEPDPLGPPRVERAPDDARDAQAFVERWRPRVEAMTNARHRGMLRVILGETLEQQRFFEQALAGRTDLLGRREEQLAPSHGEVLSSRWIE